MFVSRTDNQARRILDHILKNPESGAILSPHFGPSRSSCVTTVDPSNYLTDGFVQMYQRIVRVVSTATKDYPDVLFVLLTKVSSENLVKT